MATQVVSELGPDDVLFGRGAPIVQTTGNVRFRDIVNANKAAYANTRCRQTKDSIARDIINAIDERGGKFLKEVKSSEDARKYDVPPGAKAWIVAEYDEIVEKVKQTLRETEKSTVEKDADTRLPTSTWTEIATTGSTAMNTTAAMATTAAGPDRHVDINDSFFQVPSDGSISSSLLPLIQQQLVTMQNNQRRYQIQQELALSLQLQQYQNQLLAASFGTASVANGRMTPNMVAHQASFGLGSSSIPGQMSIEECLLALQGRGAGPTNGIGSDTNSAQLLSSIPSNQYFPSVPSATLSLLNTRPSQSAIEEILQRDAVLTALRRHRQQMENGFDGVSAIRSNGDLTQNHNVPHAEASLVNHGASMSTGSRDLINDTPNNNNFHQLEEIASSLLSQHMNDPTHLLSQMNRPAVPLVQPMRSSMEGTNHTLKSALLSDDSNVHPGHEERTKHKIPTTGDTTEEETSFKSTSKKKRRDK